jgi:hypothetical protein
LAVQAVANGGEGGEPDGLGPVGLQDRQVDHADAGAAGELGHAHPRLVEYAAEVDADPSQRLVRVDHQISSSVSRAKRTPCSQMI